MKPIQKYIILFSGFIISLLLGYMELQNMSTPISQLDTGVIDTNTASNTTKTSHTLSDSGSVWGVNPFQTGSSSTGKIKESEPTKPLFQKPNIEWKTRTLSGITYVFGEGNPKEIDEKLKDYHQYVPEGRENMVQPKNEQSLATFLSNPMLATIINKCWGYIKPDINASSELEKNLPSSLFTTDFSMESMLSVDPSNGEKLINTERLDLFGSMFASLVEPDIQFIDRKIIHGISGAPARLCLNPDEMGQLDELLLQYLYIGNNY